MQNQETREACRTAAQLRACRAILRAWHPAIGPAARGSGGSQAAGRYSLAIRSGRNSGKSAAPNCQKAIISRTLCHGIADRLRAVHGRTMRIRTIRQWWSVLTACGAASYPVNFAHFRPRHPWSAMTISGLDVAVVESDQIRPGDSEYRYIGPPIF